MDNVLLTESTREHTHKQSTCIRKNISWIKFALIIFQYLSSCSVVRFEIEKQTCLQCFLPIRRKMKKKHSLCGFKLCDGKVQGGETIH